MSTQLEKQVTSAALGAIGDAIKSELIGYNKPLSHFVNQVMECRAAEIRSAVDTAVGDLINGPEFRKQLDAALKQKLAKTLVSRMGGALEKRVNEMMGHPETRAKVSLAIGKALDKL